MGLGLPIARRLARAMGGDVWYERRFPTGARFCYSLPLNRRTALADGDVPTELVAEDMVRVELSERV
jgi:K+-sensing histidine kinase KdpD